jgi:hypothetical protein
LVTADSTAPARLLDRTDLPALVRPHEQLRLFEAAAGALSGEL